METKHEPHQLPGEAANARRLAECIRYFTMMPNRSRPLPAGGRGVFCQNQEQWAAAASESNGME